MIKIKPIGQIPEELFTDANRYAMQKLHLRRFMDLSPEKIYVADLEDRPLMLIGAFRPTLLSPYKELWMIGTKYLRLDHIKLGRELIWSWVRAQELDIYARSETRSTARFLRFIGFTEIDRDNNITLFKAKI